MLILQDKDLKKLDKPFIVKVWNKDNLAPRIFLVMSDDKSKAGADTISYICQLNSGELNLIVKIEEIEWDGNLVEIV